MPCQFDMIDYIYYNATTTDEIGTQTIIEGQYFVPFLDFLYILFVFSFTILIVWFVYYVGYKKDKKINLHTKHYITGKRLKDIF